MSEHKASFLKRSWVEIDLQQLIANIDAYRAHIGQDMPIMAVVKADAYGHGYAPVSFALQSAGVSLFAVSNLGEAIALREAGITGDILILGFTPPEQAARLASYNLIQALLSEQYAQQLWEACHYPLRCQFAVDSGMNRIGLPVNDGEGTEACIRRYAARFCLTGIFTHLCAADGQDEESRDFTREQIDRFEALADRLADLSMPYVHCLNSAGGLYHRTKHTGVVRLGIAMYGLAPSPENTLPPGILPVLSWKSVIAMLKTVGAGQTVGYGREGRLDRETKIATVPTGYADGYSRRLSGKGYALVRGRRAPILGRVCMDMMMLDVTDIPDACEGDEVVLLGESGGERMTADDMAEMIGTIGYEVVCAISARVPRVYK